MTWVSNLGSFCAKWKGCVNNPFLSGKKPLFGFPMSMEKGYKNVIHTGPRQLVRSQLDHFEMIRWPCQAINEQGSWVVLDKMS